MPSSYNFDEIVNLLGQRSGEMQVESLNGITLADITLLAYTRQAHRGGFDMNARPKLRKWIARCEAELRLKAV